MRSSRFIVLGSLVVFAALGWAQKATSTEVETDGLAGPVKSVSTVVQMSDVQWLQPNGPALITPLWCRDCAYTSDGYRTRSGEVADGKFIGETIALTRGPDGHVAEVLATNAQTGQVSRQTVMGPYGKAEETIYQDGKISQQRTVRYDAHGHQVESIAVDAAGDVVNRGTTKWTDDGTWTESAAWGKDQHLINRATYDPASDEQHYTEYDESGSVALAWTFAHGQVTSFWEPADSARPFGASLSDFSDKANVKAWGCRGDTGCEASQVHYEFADPAKKNPTSVEWRDAAGKLLYGAYYVYAFDQNGNWTHREISVLSPELGARTTYETDDRLITYWD